MKYYAPSYYSSFSCIGGKCTHSCCAGWEIDIDEETLERYRTMPGPTGELIRSRIDESGDTPCFRMTDENRCPFLNQDGLCDLIIAEGEDVLCQICTDHPRFRNFFADSEEIGLGMCCEAAVRLILTWREPVDLQLIDDDGWDDPESEEEQALIELRDELTAVIQNRSFSTLDRVRQLVSGAGFPCIAVDWQEWADFLLALERLDDAWADRLHELKTYSDCPDDIFGDEAWEIAFEQLMVYLLYRHMPAALTDGDAAGRIGYCALMWALVRKLCAVHHALHGSLNLEDMVQICRMYSSEIEYSDVNTDEILDRMTN